VEGNGYLKKSGKKLIRQDIWCHLLDGWTPPNPSTLMMRRSAFLELGGFDIGLSSVEDHDLWMRVALGGAKVAFEDMPLSYFTMDGKDRISFNSRRRFQAMEKFLIKWKKEIISSEGSRKYRWFKHDYAWKVAFPIFYKMVRHRQIHNALPVFLRYLLCNPLFYSYVSREVLKRSNRRKTGIE
jgi:hypothetical protein